MTTLLTLLAIGAILMLARQAWGRWGRPAWARWRLDCHLQREADIRAEEANHRFLAAMQANVSGKAFLTKQYQAAILQREQRHETLVSALRRNGAAQTVDAEAQVYAALWLYRRGDGSKAAIRALADVLDRCADTLDQQRHRNKAGKSSPEPRTRQ